MTLWLTQLNFGSGSSKTVGVEEIRGILIRKI